MCSACKDCSLLLWAHHHFLVALQDQQCLCILCFDSISGHAGMELHQPCSGFVSRSPRMHSLTDFASMQGLLTLERKPFIRVQGILKQAVTPKYQQCGITCLPEFYLARVSMHDEAERALKTSINKEKTLARHQPKSCGDSCHPILVGSNGYYPAEIR